jgi:hypothetical protein
MDKGRRSDKETGRTPPPTGLASAKSRARALFLLAAFLSFVLSVILFFGGNEDEGIFVGLWVPSILALGALLAPSWRD